MALLTKNCHLCNAEMIRDITGLQFSGVVSLSTNEIYGSEQLLYKAEKFGAKYKHACKACYISSQKDLAKRKEDAATLSAFVSSTNTIANYKVVESLGIVGGQTVFGVNVIKDIFTGVTDIVGGRSNTLEKIMRDGREDIIKQLLMNSVNLGGNAVIGFSIDLETINSSFMFLGAGTAVVVEKNDHLQD